MPEKALFSKNFIKFVKVAQKISQNFVKNHTKKIELFFVKVLQFYI